MTHTEPVVDGRTLRHQHRRPELLAAAVEYILDHGIADLSLRPMAKDLGVTHATLLRHFRSKEELVVEVVNQIRADLLGRPGGSSGGSARNRAGATLEDWMWAAWHRLCQPKERRQFALLFELVAMHARDPDRFGSLAPALITDFLGPLEARLQRDGLSPHTAREVATAYLAQVRGLQLDLAVSGDQRRVDEAMRRYIDSITPNDA